MRRAYLTIDDAPTRDFRRKVDYLAKAGVPAIFFCTGEKLERHPADAVYAIKRGFIIASHAFGHTAFSRLSLDECRSEIERCDALIERAYARAGVSRPVKWFRFPFGDKGDRPLRFFHRFSGKPRAHREAIQRILRELGYTAPPLAPTHEHYRKGLRPGEVDWGWTLDTYDYMPSLPEQDRRFGLHSLDALLDRLDHDDARAQVHINDGTSDEIILLHDQEDIAAFFIPLVEKLLTKGIVFSTPLATRPRGKAAGALQRRRLRTL